MMNTNPKNECAIADNEHMKARIPELIYKRLLIVSSDVINMFSGAYSSGAYHLLPLVGLQIDNESFHASNSDQIRCMET